MKKSAYSTVFIFLLPLGLIALILWFTWHSDAHPAAEVIYRNHCGSCHMVPNPGRLPRKIWKENVLPEMAARMGIDYGGYNPYNGLSMEEAHIIRNAGIYPEKAVLSPPEWDSLVSYLLSQAPEIITPPDRVGRAQNLTGFSPEAFRIDRTTDLSLVTSINFDTLSGNWMIGMGEGQLYSWHPKTGSELKAKFYTPVIDFHFDNQMSWVLEMGKMHPNELSRGTLWQVDSSGSPIQLFNNLKRPVDMQRVDLDQDGKEEFLVCEYGNRIGQLSLFWIKEGEWVKSTLLPFPGAIKTEVSDMNGDGRRDILVLFAQGDEGLYILYQNEPMRFRGKKVIRKPPLSGSSDFEMADFNQDGLKDIVIAYGDNADYSPVLKDFHGVEIYLNQGDGEFSQGYFFPVYGATQVEAEDYDSDGDIDLAVSCFFPDFEEMAEESFLYLENRTSREKLKFIPHSMPDAVYGRWLLLESGDTDGDGNPDLLLGSFTYSPDRIPKDAMQIWSEKDLNFIHLKNRFNKGGQVNF